LIHLPNLLSDHCARWSKSKHFTIFSITLGRSLGD
jgi:hypothetical protein